MAASKRYSRMAGRGRAVAPTAALSVLVAVAGCGGSPAGTASQPQQTQPQQTQPQQTQPQPTQPQQTQPQPTASPTSPGPSLRALAADYLAVARSANRQLDHEVDAYGDDERGVSAAEAALRAEAVTERWFDQHLLKIPFPPKIAVIARAIVAVNQQRIALTERQARARTITALRALDARHKAADAALEAGVRVIRSQLGLPPPDTD